MLSKGFPKGQRLRSKKDFETIFNGGNSIKEFPLKFLWTLSSEKENSIVLGISVPKRKFKRAVDRNMMKRRIREVYRRNSSFFIKILQECNTSINCVVVYIGDTKASQEIIEKQMIIGLKKIVESCESI